MNRLKRFFSPAREARVAYVAGQQNGAITPPAFHRGVMTVALIGVWACIAMLAQWTHLTLAAEVSSNGRLLADGNVLMALVVGIALIVALRKAIFITVLAALVIASRTPAHS